MRSHITESVGSAKGLLAELWSDGRGWILVTIAFGWLLSHGVRQSYPALLPFFRDDFGIGLTVSGFILTALYLAYGLGQLPGGILGDRFGEGRILAYSTVVSALGLAIVMLSTGVWLLLAGTVAYGVATAMYAPMRFTVFTDIYDKRSGSAIGLTMAAGSVGDAILPVVAVLVATYMAWQISFGLLIPLFILAAVALWITVPTRTSGTSSAVDEFSRKTLRRIASGVTGKTIPTVIVIHMLLNFASQGLLGFYPTYLVDVKGLSPAVAATLFALLFVVGSLVQPVAGFGGDQFGPRLTLATVLLVSASGIWLLPFTTGIFPLLAITLMLGVYRGFSVITQTYVANRLPPDMKGTGLGLLRTMFIFVGAGGPVVVGVLGDIGYIDEAFMLLAAIVSIALGLTILRLK